MQEYFLYHPAGGARRTNITIFTTKGDQEDGPLPELAFTLKSQKLNIDKLFPPVCPCVEMGGFLENPHLKVGTSGLTQTIQDNWEEGLKEELNRKLKGFFK